MEATIVSRSPGGASTVDAALVAALADNVAGLTNALRRRVHSSHESA